MEEVHSVEQVWHPSADELEVLCPKHCELASPATAGRRRGRACSWVPAVNRCCPQLLGELPRVDVDRAAHLGIVSKPSWVQNTEQPTG
jgi:hypothetical protein